MQIIDSYNKPRILPIANHEAGHYITAASLGFELGDLCCRVDNYASHDASSEIFLNHGINSFEEVKLYCENRIKVLYAGAVAECYDRNKKDFDGNQIERIFNEGGKTDHLKIKELLRILRNMVYPASKTTEEIDANLKELGDRLINEAAAIVEENIDLILGIGDMLFQRVTHYGKEFRVTRTEIENIPNYRKKFIDKKEDLSPDEENTEDEPKNDIS